MKVYTKQIRRNKDGMTDREISKMLQQHKVWLENCGECGRRADFSGKHIERFCFVGADLRHANFRNAYADGCVFDYARLQDTDFTGCSLYKASFEHTSMDRVGFEGANLEKTNFRNASLNGAFLNGADWKVSGADCDMFPIGLESSLCHIDNETAANILYIAIHCIMHSKNVSPELKEDLFSHKPLIDLANKSLFRFRTKFPDIPGLEKSTNGYIVLPESPSKKSVDISGKISLEINERVGLSQREKDEVRAALKKLADELGVA